MKVGLIPKLLAGIIIGMLAGLYLPDEGVRLFITVKGIIGQFIGFTVPLIIVFFITSGVAQLGNQSGKTVGMTVAVAYLSTICAGTLAYFAASNLIPLLAAGAGNVAGGGEALKPFFELKIDPMMGVMTALVTAFLFGIGLSKIKNDSLYQFFQGGKAIIDLVIVKVIIPILPFYIAAIFAGMASEGQVFETVKVFGIVLLLAVALHWIWLIVLYGVSAGVSGRSPLRALRNMLPAYMTAIGTMSSAATIPVTLSSVKKLGVKGEVANFVVPLSATIHLSGSTITLLTCSMAVMFLSNGLAIPGYFQVLPFIAMLGIMMVAAPGVPGGAVMASIGLLGSMLGFDEAAIGLMIALYMAQDSFGTACNVTGDGAIAMLVEKWSGNSANASAKRDIA
ncbi:dicarboxylate/amino acid:cation symporter [Ammoniphilus sp. CFH 90114]|uniref:dicarboxylate/amino acid:cation symporter n=1 Tax=Ammoniphilus sp. CFH 90114 TaxID=2493665 RepID=UPI00100EF5A9|nr:dicarboxylate/amino acid:cation symporter [Ammoniphilus sp. CFH 90114]RXT07191.1 dicarboxylate/amino acid:cation symporter [Ammoniphilus sp. CFH 90114]